MTDMGEVVSVKVDEKTKRLMKMHDEINWSAVVRRSIERKLEEADSKKLDVAAIDKAIKSMDETRKKHRLKKGEKTSEELIREWRDKRRF